MKREAVVQKCRKHDQRDPDVTVRQQQHADDELRGAHEERPVRLHECVVECSGQPGQRRRVRDDERHHAGERKNQSQKQAGDRSGNLHGGSPSTIASNEARRNRR
jgi:hypothetical protein